MDTTSGENLRKLPERRIIWSGQVSCTDRVSDKDAWYEGAGIYRGGVSLHGTYKVGFTCSGGVAFHDDLKAGASADERRELSCEIACSPIFRR